MNMKEFFKKLIYWIIFPFVFIAFVVSCHKEDEED